MKKMTLLYAGLVISCGLYASQPPGAVLINLDDDLAVAANPAAHTPRTVAANNIIAQLPGHLPVNKTTHDALRHHFSNQLPAAVASAGARPATRTAVASGSSSSVSSSSASATVSAVATPVFNIQPGEPAGVVAAQAVATTLTALNSYAQSQTQNAATAKAGQAQADASNAKAQQTAKCTQIAASALSLTTVVATTLSTILVAVYAKQP